MKSKLKKIITDPPIICEEIENFIEKSMKDLKREGVAIGLSGGLDSAVTAKLAVRSLGRNNE